METQAQPTTARTGHSSLGMASAIIAGGLWILVLALVLTARAEARANPDLFEQDFGPAFALGGYVVLCALGQLAALGLAVAGLAQRKRKRHLAAVGLALSGGMIVLSLMAAMA